MSIPDDLPEDPQSSYNPEITEILSTPTPRGGSLAESRPLRNVVEDFDLLNVAGEGGFGEVWRANQYSLGRIVALKRIRSGMRNTGAVEDAFRIEALTTARLEHPNIIPMYDLGADEAGLPVLVMRYVEGHTWLSLLNKDFSTLSVADFLAKHLPILIDVAQATAYAHSRGVVHRDLKPSQVMLGEFGEVLLMDWGLAVALYRIPKEIGASEMASGGTNPAGTVAYMAPEQTLRTTDRIGPWTDVYLLGGILFTLLTSRAPHDADDSRTAFEMARDGQFPDPKEAAEGREVPEELRQLVFECLEPEREQRIQSAMEIVQRLQAYLSGAGKRRESESMALRASAMLENSDGSYASYGAIIDLLQRAAISWPDNPAVAPLFEEVSECFARAAIRNRDLMLARIEAGRIANEERREALFAEISAKDERTKAIARQRKIASRLAAALLGVIIFGGGIYTWLLARAQAEEKAAHARAEKLLEFMLSDLRIGLEPIGRLDLLDGVSAQALLYFDSIPSRSLSDKERAQRATMLDAIGYVLKMRGKLDDAEKAFNEASAIRNDLLHKDPSSRERQNDVAMSHYFHGVVARARGDVKTAVADMRTSQKMIETVLAAEPDHHEWRRELAARHSQIGEILMQQGDVKGALAEYTASTALLDKIVAAIPSDLQVREELGVSHSKIGDVLDAAGDGDGALREYRTYMSILIDLTAKQPSNLLWRRELAVAHNSIGWGLRSKGQLDDAIAEFQQQREIMEDVVNKEPGNTAWQRELAFSHAVIGRVFKAKGEVAPAIEHITKATQILGVFAERDRSNATWSRDYAMCDALLGDVLFQGGRLAEASSEMKKTIATMERLSAIDPSNTGWTRDLAQARRVAGSVLLALGRRDEAHAELERTVLAMQPLTRDVANAPVMFLDTHASALILLGRRAEAQPMIDALAKRGYKDPTYAALVDKVH